MWFFLDLASAFGILPACSSGRSVVPETVTSTSTCSSSVPIAKTAAYASRWSPASAAMTFPWARVSSTGSSAVWPRCSDRLRVVALVFVDTTSVYVHCDTDTLYRTWGYSRDRRGDLPQLVLCVAVDRDGWPVSWEAIPANTADPDLTHPALTLEGTDAIAVAQDLPGVEGAAGATRRPRHRNGREVGAGERGGSLSLRGGVVGVCVISSGGSSTRTEIQWAYCSTPHAPMSWKAMLRDSSIRRGGGL